MARGGKRKGAGRKPTGKVAMLVRVSPEIRTRLERDAKRAGRSLSHEAEVHLADALRASQRADKQTQALSYLIAQMVLFAQTVERAAGPPEFSWRDDRFDFEAFKYALMLVLDHLAPAGAVESSRYPTEQTQTPKDMGGLMAAMVIFPLMSDGARLAAIGDRRGAPRGSYFYAFPQAARDLGYKTKQRGLPKRGQ
jgi:hypothetical protein